MGALESTERKVEYVKMVKNGPNKKAEMIFTGLTFIVSVLLIVFAIVPTFKTVKDISDDIKKKEQVSEALNGKLEALTSLDGQYNQNEEVFKNLTLIFPTSQNFSLFLANIDAIITRNNFLLDSISFSENKKSSTDGNEDIKTKVLVPYAVTLSVTGNRIDLVTLLKDLEALPMYPVVESISYSSKVDADGKTQYSLSLRIYQIENVNFYD